MSISSAMQSGVSGLLANSTAISSVSDNIANANTTGYRRSFAQMITSTSESATGFSSNSVRAATKLDMSEGSNLNSTGSATDLAISGQGFFVVSRNANDPNVANYVLTRAGSFLPDANGDLVNSAGYFLAGFAFGDDGTLGSVDQNSFKDLTTVNIDTSLAAGTATSVMTIAGNLPSQETGVTVPAAPFASSAEFFSPLGQADRLQFTWQPTTTANQWGLAFSDLSGNTYGNVTVTFNDSGTNAGSPATYSGVTSTATAPAAFAFNVTTGLATLTINNGTAPQVLTVAVGTPNTFGGMSQFAGDYTSLDVTANGSASGNLVGTDIDKNGNIFGVYDTGNRRALFNVPLADTANPVGLAAGDGNVFKLTRVSGSAKLGTAGAGSFGIIKAGVLESSNVEIAQELTDLIRIQRAYSSNAKIITTMDEMLDETTRLKR